MLFRQLPVPECPGCPTGAQKWLGIVEFMATRFRRFAVIAAGAALAAAALTACSSSTAATPVADSVTVADAWVKATDGPMTGAFANVTNGSDKEIKIMAASTPVAKVGEVHEMAPNDDGGMTMRAVEGGLAIAPGATQVFKPGSEHIMLMELKQPIIAGSDVEITLEFDDGSTKTVTAQARDFSGNQESYDSEGNAVMGDGGGE
jgi:copper(I)-binding protein